MDLLDLADPKNQPRRTGPNTSLSHHVDAERSLSERQPLDFSGILHLPPIMIFGCILTRQGLNRLSLTVSKQHTRGSSGETPLFIALSETGSMLTSDNNLASFKINIDYWRYFMSQCEQAGYHLGMLEFENEFTASIFCINETFMKMKIDYIKEYMNSHKKVLTDISKFRGQTCSNKSKKI